MSERRGRDGKADPEGFSREVGKREVRKLKARRRGERGVWFGMGMFGLIGWSVAVPAIVGVALGVRLDSAWPGRVSWTLTLLLAGVALGCLNAWYWVCRERKEIEVEGEDGQGG